MLELFTSCEQLRAVATINWRYSTTHWDSDSRQSSTLVWPPTDGYKPHCRFKTADWWWEAIACWHLLPIWLQLQSRFPIKTSFWKTHAPQIQIQQSVRLLPSGRPYPEQKNRLIQKTASRQSRTTLLHQKSTMISWAAPAGFSLSLSILLLNRKSTTISTRWD